MRIGVDTGGTFTDCVIFDAGRIRILKVFTSAQDPAGPILAGVQSLAEAASGPQAREPLTLIHGTTMGTNTLLERRGARVALVTTAGFEDLLEIGRQNRPSLYDFDADREPPLVPSALRWGIKERVVAGGEVLARPSRSEIERLRARLIRSRPDAVALCFLFSFANTANERAVARAIRGLGLPVSVSHEILPEFREYERLSTVVINAYLAPRVGRYLMRLITEARKQFATPVTRKASVKSSSRAQVYVMQSSGGITTAARSATEPVRTILSGPAGGVVATRWLADQAGVQRVISFDMGGTSTDVCLLDGAPRTTSETTLGGLPVAVPVLDVHSVGAGGGSLARLDAGGALRVGPESAGASPGPICYGRGGTQPTVTDAHLILGRLDPEFFLGGEFRLDADATERAFSRFLRDSASNGHKPAALSLQTFRTPLELARGIVAVANAHMEKALRVISVERGHDPRDFALVCFGGAGGLHAAELARSLRMTRVIVPSHPGAFSALGVLLSDIVKDVSQSVLTPLLSGAARTPAHRGLLRQLERDFAGLERRAREELRKDGFGRASAAAERKLDLRYAGQSYEIAIPFTPQFAERFHEAHEKAYGYSDAARPLEIVNLRVRLTIATPKPPRNVRPRARKQARADKAVVHRKPVWFPGGLANTPFYDRERLPPGGTFYGPAIVVEYSATTVIPPDFLCRVDEYGNLILARALESPGVTRRTRQA